MSALAKQTDAQIIERVIALGDLSKLNPTERVEYYRAVCSSLGLNPFTRPFEFITLNGKLVLYARKDATEQLRKINGVSIYKVEKEQDGDLYAVTAYARDATGREDIDMGAVSTAGMKGENLVNARLKAITKAKRRVTLSICGLAFLDESEIESIPDARPVRVADDGEIVEPKPVAQFPAQPAASPTGSRTATDAEMITQAQGRSILALCKAKGRDAQSECRAKYDCDYGELSREKAGEFIDYLTALPSLTDREHVRQAIKSKIKELVIAEHPRFVVFEAGGAKYNQPKFTLWLRATAKAKWSIEVNPDSINSGDDLPDSLLVEVPALLQAELNELIESRNQQAENAPQSDDGVPI